MELRTAETQNEVEKFLEELGRELRRTPEQMKPIIDKIVVENWYDTLDSLRSLSESQWHAMQLPLRLIEEIQRRLPPAPQQTLEGSLLTCIPIKVFGSLQEETDQRARAGSGGADSIASGGQRHLFRTRVAGFVGIENEVARGEGGVSSSSSSSIVGSSSSSSISRSSRPNSALATNQPNLSPFSLFQTPVSLPPPAPLSNVILSGTTRTASTWSNWSTTSQFGSVYDDRPPNLEEEEGEGWVDNLTDNTEEKPKVEIQTDQPILYSDNLDDNIDSNCGDHQNTVSASSVSSVHPNAALNLAVQQQQLCVVDSSPTYADSRASRDVNHPSSSPSNQPFSPPTSSPASFVSGVADPGTGARVVDAGSEEEEARQCRSGISKRGREEAREAVDIKIGVNRHRMGGGRRWSKSSVEENMKGSGMELRVQEEPDWSSRGSVDALPFPKEGSGRRVGDTLSNVTLCGSSLREGSDSRNSGPASDQGVHDILSTAEVEFNVVDDSLFHGTLHEAAENLRNEVSSLDLQELVVPTLFRILHSVLAAPRHLAKRSLRTTNATFHAKVGRFPPAVDLMKAVGFRLAGDCLVMEVAYITRLTDCHYLLAELAKSVGFQPPPLPVTSFNPYKSNVSRLAPIPQAYSESLRDRWDESDRIQEAIQQRKDYIQRGNLEDVDLSPRVFRLSDIHQVEDAVKLLEGLPEAPAAPLPVAQVLKAGEGESFQFKSRAKRELDQLNRRKVYSQSTVRVQFPGKIVLQLRFKPSHTIAYLRSQIQQCLSEEVQDSRWHIYQTPPLRYFSDHKTLYEENLVPAAMVHFKLEDSAGRQEARVSTSGYGSVGTTGGTLAVQQFLRTDLIAQMETERGERRNETGVMETRQGGRDSSTNLEKFEQDN